MGCRADEGSVDTESVTLGVVLGATACTASVGVVGVVDWSSVPLGGDDELSVGVTVEVASCVVVGDGEGAVSVAGLVD